MMPWLVLLLLFSPIFGAIAPGVCALLLAITVFVSSVVKLNTIGFVMLSLVILAAPIAGYISTQLAGVWAQPVGKRDKSLSLIVSVATMAFLLSDLGVDTALGASVQIADNITVPRVVSWVALLGSSIIFCAALPAIVIGMCGYLIEIPFHIAFRAGQRRVILPYAAIRLSFLVLCLVILLDLIASSFSSELAPYSLITRLIHTP